MKLAERLFKLERDEQADDAMPIQDLELINWVEEGEDLRTIALASGVKVKTKYRTFEDLRSGILEHGPLVVPSKIADIIFLVLDGEYDNQIMAVRHSGRNIRRFLVREDRFEDVFRDFSGCVDHLLCNHIVECEIEIRQLRDMAETLDLTVSDFDAKRDYDRFEVDITAALQLLNFQQKSIDDDLGDQFSFDLGYCVGRLFSSAQNLATLEPDANRAHEYERSYRERGKKGKSQVRKQQRLDHLFEHICKLVDVNPGFSRMKPTEVARLAIADAVEEYPELWTQGRGQLENYLTCFASDERYRKTFRKLFPKAG